MRLLIVTVVSLIQAALWSTGEGYTVSTGIPATKEYKVGDTFTLKCTGTSTADENVTPLLLKTNIHLDTFNGAAASEDPTVFPFVVAEGSTIATKIEEVAPGRYTAAVESADATNFDYAYTISSLETQDSGNYTCGVKHGANQEIAPGAVRIPVLVLEKIKKMAILYKKNSDSDTSLENNPGLNDNDGKLTYTLEDPAGELACLVQSSTSLPYDCKLMLNDPLTKEDIDVTNKFSKKYGNPTLTVNGPFMTVDELDYLVSGSPSGDRFGKEDSGKTLKCSCKSTGFDEVIEVETVLDIEYPPVAPLCSPGNPEPEGPIGTKNFTLLCYTMSNPESDVTWTANAVALRDGINIQTWNEGKYKVSMMIIEELQEADYTTYKFTATNSVGSSSIPDMGSNYTWEIKKGDEVNMASKDSSGFPWNKENSNNPSTASTSLVSTVSLTLMALLVLFI